MKKIYHTPTTYMTPYMHTTILCASPEPALNLSGNTSDLGIEEPLFGD